MFHHLFASFLVATTLVPHAAEAAAVLIKGGEYPYLQGLDPAFFLLSAEVSRGLSVIAAMAYLAIEVVS